jgi:hypothetical protein
MRLKWASLVIKIASVCRQVAAGTISALSLGGKKGLHDRMSSSDFLVLQDEDVVSDQLSPAGLLPTLP